MTRREFLARKYAKPIAVLRVALAWVSAIAVATVVADLILRGAA